MIAVCPETCLLPPLEGWYVTLFNLSDAWSLCVYVQDVPSRFVLLHFTIDDQTLRHLVHIDTFPTVFLHPQKLPAQLFHLEPIHLSLQRGTPISSGMMIGGTPAHIALGASTAQAA